MKTDMRRTLARQPFEQKIRQIGQLLQLSAKVKIQRGSDNVDSIARGTSRYIKRGPKDSGGRNGNWEFGVTRSSFPPFDGS